MINILFTCAGRRNYLINYFKHALNNKGKIIAMDMQDTAPALIDADIGIVSPSIYDENYIDFLINNIEKYDINALISLNDLELPILSINREKLSINDTKILISDNNAIEKSFDKWKTFQFLIDIGLKTPKTYKCIDKVKVALKNQELKFPLVIKPRWGSASINIDIAENIEDLNLIYQLQLRKLKVQKSLKAL